MSVFVLAPAAPAQAAPTCRQVARDLTAVVAKTANLAEGKQAFSDAQQAHPDCQAEFMTLGAWYDGGGRDPYPFKAEDDPAKPFLGPVGWWWNTIYVSWFQRNVLLMVLFGWELFLTPIAVIVSIGGALTGGIGGLFRRGPSEG